MKIKLILISFISFLLFGCSDNDKYADDDKDTINYNLQTYCNNIVNSSNIIFNNKVIGVTKEQNFKVVNNGIKAFHDINRGYDIVPPPVSQLRIISILVFESNDSKEVVANKVKDICTYSDWAKETFNYYGRNMNINFN